MTLTQRVVESVARRLKIPQIAVRMFTTANQLSGIDRKSLPTELIPLNTVQLARGLLNFALLQTSRDWVLPYWAERQYDPASVSFVPRSHLGLSMNVTHRNWTAVGNPECPVEPIVDPRGLVMPFPNGWSIDCWLIVDQHILFTSRAATSSQSLLDGYPVVFTLFEFEGIGLQLTTTTVGCMLHHEVTLESHSGEPKSCSAVMAIRPFNPEGISLVHDITYDEQTGFRINDEHTISFSEPPARIHCSTRKEGDAAFQLQHRSRTGMSVTSHCRDGLANAFAAFDLSLLPSQKRSIKCSCQLDDANQAISTIDFRAQATSYWENTLAAGTTIITPDQRVNALLRSSLATLLMLTDRTSITPGPYTYHQFWFRDAAYMLRALDVFGFFSFTEPVIRSFPGRQERSGYFRSQQGEWDSNGEALWAVWQHGMLASDTSLFTSMWNDLSRGAVWIKQTRIPDTDLSSTAYAGLMPAGLSAEHLGLADHYYWDNFWSVAGLEAFGRICAHIGRQTDRIAIETLVHEYRRSLENSIAHAAARLGTEVIPASPTRGIDCGMVGSCAAWYPLQLFPPDDPRLTATLTTLMERFFFDGMFFQDFIHSGMNPYLTLHIAQAWLYAGKRKEFWELLTTVIEHASPTLNYPEAIHPLTRGGSMGDGHHGWAAAEIALALRNAFVFEHWRQNEHTVILLSGIPSDWFAAGNSFSIARAPIPGGTIGIAVSCEQHQSSVKIAYQKVGTIRGGRWVLRLPFKAKAVRASTASPAIAAASDTETVIAMQPEETEITISLGS